MTWNLKRHAYDHKFKMPPTLVIELKNQTPSNIALIERAGTAAYLTNPFWMNATMYQVAFIRMNETGNPEIGLTEI